MTWLAGLSPAEFLIYGGIAWLLLAVVVAVLIGRSIRHADERAPKPPTPALRQELDEEGPQ